MHQPSPIVPGNDERHDPASPSPNKPIASTRGLRHTDLEATNSPESPNFSPALRRAIYAQMVGELKARYKISIRKWRSHMSGVAYELKYPTGMIRRMVTAPRPRSPVSAAIFLHEVGHHAVGFRRYAPRCLEEYYVWQWAFREMLQRNIPVTPRVLAHYRRSMYHYVHLARKRSVPIPHELHEFLHWPG